MWPNSQTVVEDGCTSSECFKGYYADVFNVLQSVLNFTYVISVEDIAGAKREDGTWIGQIGSSYVDFKNIIYYVLL